jgi:hypothetical protein
VSKETPIFTYNVAFSARTGTILEACLHQEGPPCTVPDQLSPDRSMRVTCSRSEDSIGWNPSQSLLSVTATRTPLIDFRLQQLINLNGHGIRWGCGERDGWMQDGTQDLGIQS